MDSLAPRFPLLLLVAAAALASGCDDSTPRTTPPQPARTGPRAAAPVPANADDAEHNWGQWRGPLANGTAPHADPPTTWSEDKNVRWKIELPGTGSSSPIVWGRYVFVQTAIPTQREGKPPAGPRPNRHQPPGGDSSEPMAWQQQRKSLFYEFAVLAIERATGHIAWQTTVATAVPHERLHVDGTQASNSPITDGEHVFADFGSRGVHCLDMDGNVVWSRDLGLVWTRLEFGEGSSPALHGDKLLLSWDNEGQSYLYALDKNTGATLWRTPRDQPTTWTTPLVVPVGDRYQVVVNGWTSSSGYDLDSGELLWTAPCMTKGVAQPTPYAVASPVCFEDMVLLHSWRRGNGVQALRLTGARGQLHEGQHIAWKCRGAPYVPSALLYRGVFYHARRNSGVLSAHDAKTGKEIFTGKRLRGIRTLYSSPVAAAGRVYLTARKGTTVVLEHGPDARRLASNKLDEHFDASAALVGGEIYLRGRKHLYCLANG